MSHTHNFSIFILTIFVTYPLNTLAQTTNEDQETASTEKQIRFATFNTSFNRSKQGELQADLDAGTSLNIRRVAEVIQRVRPDVILLNEFDYDAEGKGIKLFQEKFLGVGQGGQKSIHYPFVFSADVNTGKPSGMDLNNNGSTDDPNDAFGFGQFPGKYGMVVLSKYPIEKEAVRSFQKFLWKEMPDRLVPKIPETGKPYWNDKVMEIFRLSSKSHWDVPIKIGDRTFHFLVCHPTPPVFDGPEDRNGARNHDEIRLWADYIDPKRSKYLVDDQGKRGGLTEGSNFVIAGDMNADPIDGESSHGAILQLLDHPLVNSSNPPASEGGVEQAKLQGRKNLQHKGNPANDTGDFRDDSSGNVRIDYVLPSRTLKLNSSGVFWPKSDDKTYPLVRASDHHLVWIEVE